MARDPLKSQEELARAVARTKGEGSEAAKALKELETRRSAGESVIVFPLRGKWLVGPRDEVQATVTSVNASVERKRAKTLREKELSSSARGAGPARKTRPG